ncbi:MAG: IS30 family transposase [Steroidobacteraceae bacterium]
MQSSAYRLREAGCPLLLRVGLRTRPCSRESKGEWDCPSFQSPTSRPSFHLVRGVCRRWRAGCGIAQTKEVVTSRAIRLIQAHPKWFKTITAANGTEFHDYPKIEAATGVSIYFAHPYHSWERGTNENTNGLIRQYLPKRHSMAHVTQHRCNAIALALNIRPRKRHAFQSPAEVARDQ